MRQKGGSVIHKHSITTIFNCWVLEMGVASSRIEEDKALLLCQQRKKFVRQALDGRCSLAAAHVTYIQSLRSTGVALRKFVEPETVTESSLYTSTAATSEPHALTEKSISQFSLSSPSVSQHVDAVETFSQNLSPPKTGQFQANYMKTGGSSSTIIEEKPPFAVTGTLRSAAPQVLTPRSSERHETSPFKTSELSPGTPFSVTGALRLDTPQNLTPRSNERDETSPFKTPELSPRTPPPPWDYFGLPLDSRLSFEDGRGSNHGLEYTDHIGQSREEEGISELEEEEEKSSFTGRPVFQESEDEFDEVPMDNLVRSFKNLNTVDISSATVSPTMLSAREINTSNGDKTSSPDLTPSKGMSSIVSLATDEKGTAEKEPGPANGIAPKDFISSIKEIESLFLKASESGIEVPRMLEANKFHFRPVFHGKEGSRASMFLKGCFSCGEDPTNASQEPPPTETKYLTWPKTGSSCSSSSRNLLGSTLKGDLEDMSNNLFSSSFMNSGSHASTLDRLFAWERKLYDEIKASGIIRREYDMKCKLLRQQDSKAVSTDKINKTRTIVKDLHSRIRVAIHRIDSISKTIEELRDKELQPQLEELIEGLSRMWEMMFEYHKLQYNIISAAYHHVSTKVSMHTELHRQATVHLQNELSTLSSSFMKWTSTQISYVKAIDGWLHKCIFLQQKYSRRGKKMSEPPLRYRGPPIFVTCGVWLEKLKDLPSKEVADSINGLLADTTSFLPQHDKSSKKPGDISEAAREEALEDWNSGFNGFRSSLVAFLDRLNCFAESSVKMYGELKKAIEGAKVAYEQNTAKSL